METFRLDLKSLRNEEHYQFHAEMMQLILSMGAKEMNIEEIFAEYVKLNADELDALQQIRKSALSKLLPVAN